MRYCNKCRFQLATLFLTFMIFFTINGSGAWAQATVGSDLKGLNVFTNNADKPLDIEADSIVISEDNKSAIITGDAIISQDQSILRAEKITIHYDGKLLSDSNERQPKRLEISDGLSLNVIDGSVSATQMVYDFSTGIANLKGNVKLLYKGNRSEGEVLTIDTNKGTIRLTAGKKGRVKTRLKLTQ